MNDIQTKKRENVLAGIVGAFLFSLAGGVVWFILYQVGFLAAISGLIGVVCAIKGYQIFAKSTSKLGIILAVIIAMLILALASYCSLAFELRKALQELFEEGEVLYVPDYFECLRTAYKFLEDPDISSSFFRDLAIGLGLCILGGIRPIIDAFKTANARPDDSQPLESAQGMNYTQNAGYSQVPTGTDSQPQAFDPSAYAQAPQEQRYDWEIK